MRRSFGQRCETKVGCTVGAGTLQQPGCDLDQYGVAGQVADQNAVVIGRR